MSPIESTFVPTALFALAITFGASPVRAQEPVTKPPQVDPIHVAPSQDDVQREMIELFHKVERDLRAIDRLLQEASRAPSGGSGGSVAEQLRNAQSSGEGVQRDIDRILELAASQRPSSSSSSSSGGQQSDQGSSPMDGRGEQSTGREATPSAPQPGGNEPQPGGDQPQPGGEDQRPGDEKKPGPQEKPGDQGRENADGPDASKADPKQQPGADPRAGAQGSGSSQSDARDRWGDLPFHAREVFRNEGGRDMPPLYREWIDAYYRRLNKQP